MTLSTAVHEVIRLDAWRAVFEKTDRILSEQKVNVRIVQKDDVPGGYEDIPGWSDGLNISLNGEKVNDMLKKNDALSAVLRLKGLNYHELCHVLFTPRMSDELPRRIVEKARNSGDRSWWYAFNALEDQRIETWFTSTYGASRRYFEAVILEWIIRSGNAEAAVLVYGRKYLSPRIRVQAGRVFKKKYGLALYSEFQSVIDEYITLVLPTDSVRAMGLITKYRTLLKDMQAAHHAQLPDMPVNDNGMQDGGTAPSPQSEGAARTGRVLVKQARKARDKAEQVVEDAIDADQAEEDRRDAEAAAKAAADKQSDDPSQADDDQGGEDADQGGSDDQAQDSDGTDASQEAGDGDQGDADDAGQQTGQGDPDDAGDGAGGDPWDDWADQAGQANPNDQQQAGAQATDGAGQDGSGFDFGNGDDKSLEDELRDMVDDAYDEMDDVRDDEWVQNDVDNILDAVRAVENNGRMDAVGAEARANVLPPQEKHTLAVRRVTNILTRIRQEAEPETLRRQVYGRVDVRRVMTRQPWEADVFKTWDAGTEEETGIEAVLLMDTSISMSGCMWDASAAMWVLKRAFDKLDIRTTVLLYNTEHTVLFQPSDRANAVGIPDVKSSGGTDPTSALQQAQHILSKSQAPNKVLITVTDGQWASDDKEIHKLMKSIHRLGASSLLLGLDGAKEHYGKHDHHEAHDITQISELPKVALKLVANIMRMAQRA